jgi:hypothetical protein
MKKLVLVAVLVLSALAVPVAAQTSPPAVSSNKLGWTQTAPTLADAQALTFKLYADGAATGAVLAGVTCTATTTSGVFACEVPFPAFTPGNHSVQLTAGNVAGESAKSAPLAFTFVVVPAVPTGLVIK